MQDEASMIRYGYMMWGIVLTIGVIAGFIALGGMAAADSTDEAGNVNATTIESDRVSVEIDENYNVDVDVSLSSTDVGVGVDSENETAEVSMQSDAIDEGVESSASAGLCAVGLDSEDAPTSVDVDAENSSVSASMSPSNGTDDPYESRRAIDVVERCQTDNYGYRDGDA